jgi:NTP pyrophosphatase (non-canonical NTP hydrolase)
MNFAEYPALAARTEKELPTSFLRIEHASLGLITEIGEIGTLVKRIAIYGKSLDSVMDKGEDSGKSYRQLLGEEIGDVLWYLPIITSELDANYVFEDVRLTARTGLPLTNLTRRLSIAAGRVADYVESEAMHMLQDVNLVDEVCAILHYLVDLAGLAGLDIVQLAADNIAKLRKRYPEAYSDLAAEERADKA